MGKKSGKNGAAAVDAPKATAFVLKVPMHCRCDGCGDKIRAAVKDLTLRCDGILSLDQSALGTKGELSLVATADPERLRRRLRKSTGKSVDLVFPKPNTAKPAAAAAADGKDATAAVQALLASLQLQQQQAAAGTWNAHALQHGGYGQAAFSYPWVVQPQQAPPEPYLASYPAAAYPATSWGAYAAYPHDGLGGGWHGC